VLTIWKEELYKGPTTPMDYIKTNNHTNIILVTVPPRYDLMQSSCMNSEIKLFNRKLKKMVKVYQHMSVLEMDNDNHGLHLNSQGKEVFSKLIVSHIFNIGRENRSPINFKLEIRSKPNSSTKPVTSYKQNIYYVDHRRLNEIYGKHGP